MKTTSGTTRRRRRHITRRARFASVKDVAERYRVSVVTVWRWAREGRIPPPVQLSPGCTRWNLHELDVLDAEPPPFTAKLTPWKESKQAREEKKKQAHINEPTEARSN